jgi:hypothetical protein
VEVQQYLVSYIPSYIHYILHQTALHSNNNHNHESQLLLFLLPWLQVICHLHNPLLLRTLFSVLYTTTANSNNNRNRKMMIDTWFDRPSQDSCCLAASHCYHRPVYSTYNNNSYSNDYHYYYYYQQQSFDTLLLLLQVGQFQLSKEKLLSLLLLGRVSELLFYVYWCHYFPGQLTMPKSWRTFQTRRTQFITYLSQLHHHDDPDYLDTYSFTDDHTDTQILGSNNNTNNTNNNDQSYLLYQWRNAETNETIYHLAIRRGFLSLIHSLSRLQQPQPRSPSIQKPRFWVWEEIVDQGNYSALETSIIFGHAYSTKYLKRFLSPKKQSALHIMKYTLLTAWLLRFGRLRRSTHSIINNNTNNHHHNRKGVVEDEEEEEGEQIYQEYDHDNDYDHRYNNNNNQCSDGSDKDNNNNNNDVDGY